MRPLVLALTLLAAPAFAADPTDAVVPEAPVAPPARGSPEALLAEAFGPSARPSAVAATASPEASASKLWTLALIIVGAGGAVAWFARKQRAVGTGSVHLQVLQVARVGPKQSLVVARVGDETLVLGATEGSIQVLSSRVGPAAATSTPATDEAAALASTLNTAAPSRPSHVANAAHAAYGLRSLFGGNAAQASQPAHPSAGGREDALEDLGGFARALEQANEDQELRAKLSMRRSP